MSNVVHCYRSDGNKMYSLYLPDRWGERERKREREREREREQGGRGRESEEL